MNAIFRKLRYLIVVILSSITLTAHEEDNPGVTTILGHSEKIGDGLILTTITVHYAPGVKSKPHLHGGVVLACVLTGSIRSENSATGPARVYTAGETFFEPAGGRHLISENASATEPASLLAVFVTKEGEELTSFFPDLGKTVQNPVLQKSRTESKSEGVSSSKRVEPLQGN